MKLKNNMSRNATAVWIVGEKDKAKKFVKKVKPGEEFDCPDAEAQRLIKEAPGRWAAVGAQKQGAPVKPQAKESK